jgi:DNA primase
MIDQHTIQRIFDAADIVEVIGEFVTLKKAGQNYRGLSPFTNEKTPSFFVSPSKGIFKDFSSGKGGNVVTFLREHEKLSYPEALRYLAKKYNIEIVEKEQTPEEVQQQNERESLMIITQFADKFFRHQLFNEQEGQAVGLSYFKERGFREHILKKFQVGYSPEKRNAFTEEALRNGYKLDLLVKSGLTIQKENYTFDRFNGRVMFPIHSLSGKVLGFGGRILKSDVKAAKYLNSPESEIYHKSQILYGLYFAKSGIIKTDKCYMVEGYTDVLALHQAGIENVVASSGTALSVQQVNLIKRFTQNITIIFDGDEAGIKASMRGIDIILQEGLNVKVLLLPDGEDPDSFSKKISASELQEYIDTNEKDFITFKTKLLMGDTKDDPVKKAGLITDIVRTISVIPNGIARNVYIRECSRLMDIDEAVLFQEMNKIRSKHLENRLKQQRQQKSIEQKETRESEKTQTADIKNENYNERELIRLLLTYHDLDLFRLKGDDGHERNVTVAEFIFAELEKDDLEFTHPVYKTIYQEIKKTTSDDEGMSQKHFTYHPDELISTTSANLLTEAYDLSKIWRRKENYVETEDMKLKEVVPETVLSFKSRIVHSMLEETLHRMKVAQESEKIDDLMDIQHRIVMLNNIKRDLSRSLGNRIVG